MLLYRFSLKIQKSHTSAYVHMYVPEVEAVVLEGTREILLSMGSSQSLCLNNSIPKCDGYDEMTYFILVVHVLIYQYDLNILYAI